MVQEKRKYPGFEKADGSLKVIQNKIRREICKKTGWSYPSTYDAKKRGDRPVTEEEKPILVSVFSKYGIDYETGQTIFFK